MSVRFFLFLLILLSAVLTRVFFNTENVVNLCCYCYDNSDSIASDPVIAQAKIKNIFDCNEIINPVFRVDAHFCSIRQCTYLY